MVGDKKNYSNIIKNIFANEHSFELQEMTSFKLHITVDYSTLNYHHNHNRHLEFLTKEFPKDCGLVFPLSFSCTLRLPEEDTLTAYFFFLFFPSLLFLFLSLYFQPFLHAFIHICINSFNPFCVFGRSIVSSK